MLNGNYERPGEAFNARLRGDSDLIKILGGRIEPNKPTPGVETNRKPYISHWRITGGGSNLLSERAGTQEYFFRVEFYANSDEEAEIIREIVINRLCGNPRKSIEPWVDRPQGVFGCFTVDDADADVDDNGDQISGQTFRLFFCPQV